MKKKLDSSAFVKRGVIHCPHQRERGIPIRCIALLSFMARGESVLRLFRMNPLASWPAREVSE